MSEEPLSTQEVYKKELRQNINDSLMYSNRDSVRHRIMFMKNLIMDLNKILKAKEYSEKSMEDIKMAMVKLSILCGNIMYDRPLLRNPDYGPRGWRKDVHADIYYTYNAVTKSAEQIEKEEESDGG